MLCCHAEATTLLAWHAYLPTRPFYTLCKKLAPQRGMWARGLCSACLFLAASARVTRLTHAIPTVMHSSAWVVHCSQEFFPGSCINSNSSMGLMAHPTTAETMPVTKRLQWSAVVCSGLQLNTVPTSMVAIHQLHLACRGAQHYMTCARLELLVD